MGTDADVVYITKPNPKVSGRWYVVKRTTYSNGAKAFDDVLDCSSKNEAESHALVLNKAEP